MSSTLVSHIQLSNNTAIASLPIMKNIYPYKNDPTTVNKGVFMRDVRHAQGGYLPMLTDPKSNKADNFEYNNKLHHGWRPMHQTTFEIKNTSERSDLLTQTKIDYQAFPIKREFNMNKISNDQFRHHFDLGQNKQTRSFDTSYHDQFFQKNRDNDYVQNFDLMPKYSVGKQKYQAEKYNQVKLYPNRHSKIKEEIFSDNSSNSSWTEYKRTYDYLGAKRGIGEHKEYKDRPAYNLFTGEMLPKPAWSINDNFKKVSGNVVLDSARKNQTNIFY